MSLLALALVVAAQVNDPAGDMPPLLEAPPEEKGEPKPLEPIPEAAPPVLKPKKKAPSTSPTTPAPDAADNAAAAEEIAWAAGAGGVATGLCSACACGWVPFFGVPVVGAATALGAAGGGLYGAKDKPGWGTGILVSATIAGAGGLIGAGIGTGVMAIAVFTLPPQGGNASPLPLYGAIGGAVLLSAAGAVGGAIGGAYAIESFQPSEEESAPAPRRPTKPVRPDDGKAIARY